ncbi:sensor histidine kinase [Noviherbaspirillum massiliense]|uniref:sensor histidine kinase n=1 Tax=Noviherbaspirillum massiliense TaxID=1465823 RepID=UPI0002E79288|nr:sensor histidine kinase [Noviherbaspirillum massiliense]
MRLASFILANMELLLQEWDDFARSIQLVNRTLNLAELRDHAEEMLREIAEDLGNEQTEQQRLEKSKGRAPKKDQDSAAEIHAEARLRCGFTIDQLVSEYRALRTSVLHLWSRRTKTATWFELEDMTRFNEAVDQALAESVARYSKMISQAQDIFLGVLGHDIRTPLNAISIGAEVLMRSETLDSLNIRVASRIYDSSARIGELVDNLLDFTRMRFGMTISPTPGNLGMIGERIVEEIRSAHPDKKIALKASGNLDGHWDSGRISQVFSNLIVNALQHGSPTEPVSVVLAGSKDSAVLTVHNAGEPIPAEELGHLFEPLRRYARSPDNKYGAHSNLGLGLYIVREVVMAHGGTVEVSSNEADGTMFTVTLPRNADC